MSSQQQVLLEHLAATRWFAANGETALTSGMAFCLTKDPAAAERLSALVRRRTGLSDTELPTPVTWQSEHVMGAGARIDIAGFGTRRGMEPPTLCIEAKVLAPFGSRQVSVYAKSQQEAIRKTAAPAGALVVLVPEGRARTVREEVAGELSRVQAVERGDGWVLGESSAVAVLVLTWDEVLHAMAAADGPARHDLAQLLGACRALRGADITAFSRGDLEGGWRLRPADVRLLMDRITREASVRLGLPLQPLQRRSSGGFVEGFRYLGQEGLPNLAVGERLDGEPPPLWLRWRSDTPDAAAAAVRLSAAGHSVQRRDGHLWLPLTLTPDEGSAVRQIEDAVTRTVQLYRIATGMGGTVE